MYTAGIVVTFCLDPTLADSARKKLESASAFWLGEPQGASLPAVLETPTKSDAVTWHNWAAELPGVVAVDVVYVHWDEESAEPSDVLV